MPVPKFLTMALNLEENCLNKIDVIWSDPPVLEKHNCTFQTFDWLKMKVTWNYIYRVEWGNVKHLLFKSKVITV